MAKYSFLLILLSTNASLKFRTRIQSPRKKNEVDIGKHVDNKTSTNKSNRRHASKRPRHITINKRNIKTKNWNFIFQSSSFWKTPFSYFSQLQTTYVQNLLVWNYRLILHLRLGLILFNLIPNKIIIWSLFK